jgi:hypothetical protein
MCLFPFPIVRTASSSGTIRTMDTNFEDHSSRYMRAPASRFDLDWMAPCEQDFALSGTARIERNYMAFMQSMRVPARRSFCV